jgi:hypothetical protein
MASDNYYDYNSSQDYFEIDYQIDLFEIRLCSKSRKQNKQKMNKSSYPISKKTLQSQSTSIKINCMTDKKTRKTKQKSFHHNRHSKKSKIFECDKQFQKKSIHTRSNISLETEQHSQDFFNFRRHFYDVNHKKIKSSLEDHSDVKIVNIRVAPINKTVQKDFMKRLNTNNSYFPHLVYHGTKLNNIESILHYGFLIPHQAHPTNSEAPIISTQHGQSYGPGIYCSQTAIYSLSYLNTTNTLLVCAAIPKRSGNGKVERSHRNILVLSHVSEIIPLFLMDFKYLNGSGINYPWFNRQNRLKKIENKDVKKPVTISRTCLRKVLKCINDQVRKNNRYQVRIFDSFN